MHEKLAERIEVFSNGSTENLDQEEALEAFDELIEGLNAGTIRSASPDGKGGWTTNQWVKKGILLGFRLGQLADFSSSRFSYLDKHTYPPRSFELKDGVRIVPGGSSIRTGSYVAPGVVCMPPMYVNVGAYVDEGTMVDSHALVGSCAQVGKRVHISAAAQIGGVLEPIGAQPVIVEDDVFIGGNCGIYEGCLVRRGAVLASGVILTGATRLYDAINGRVIRREGDNPLEVPERAVIVPGARSVNTEFGREHGLSLYTPVIVKYRDESTAASTSLEDALR
jgi:2,3,4,5-tetrahydropyridine-2,6-dicarboxylate N-succinyltransferase